MMFCVPRTIRSDSCAFVPFRFVSSHVHKFLVAQPRRCFPSLTSPCLSRLNFFFYLIWERKLDAANAAAAAAAAAASMVFFSWVPFGSDLVCRRELTSLVRLTRH